MFFFGVGGQGIGLLVGHKWAFASQQSSKSSGLFVHTKKINKEKWLSSQNITASLPILLARPHNHQGINQPWDHLSFTSRSCHLIPPACISHHSYASVILLKALIWNGRPKNSSYTEEDHSLAAARMLAQKDASLNSYNTF